MPVGVADDGRERRLFDGDSISVDERGRREQHGRGDPIPERESDPEEHDDALRVKG